MAKRYESPLDVMVGTIDKLKSQRDTQLKKIAELTLQLKFLLPKYADSVLVEKLEKELLEYKILRGKKKLLNGLKVSYQIILKVVS